MVRRKRQACVAVVDDNAQVRSAIKSLLESDGLTVQSYSSAEEFLAAASGNRAACLILDFHLPGMTGRELQLALQARAQTIAVIFVTSDTHHTDLARAGAFAILSKPFDPEELLRLVQVALQAPRKRGR